MGLLLPLVVVVVVLAVTRYLASSWRYLSLPSPGLPLPVIGHIHLLLCQVELQTNESCINTEKAPTSAFSWLKAPTLLLSHLRIY